MIFVQNDPIKKRHTLGRQQRLKSRKVIDQLFNEGRSISVSPFRLHHIQLNEGTPHLQAGFGVSAKNIRLAVDRNRVKRLMKEAYRLLNSELETKLVQRNLHFAIFLLYTGKEVPTHTFVRGKIDLILQRFVKIIDETHPAGP